MRRTLAAAGLVVLRCADGDAAQIAEALNVDEDTMFRRLQMARRDGTERAYLKRRLSTSELAA